MEEQENIKNEINNADSALFEGNDCFAVNSKYRNGCSALTRLNEGCGTLECSFYRSTRDKPDDARSK